jgi:hypothetical protein
MTLGNLEALTDDDARWMAMVQRRYEETNEPMMIGGIPGKGEVYGYFAYGAAGPVLTAVNSCMEAQALKLPVDEPLFVTYSDGIAELSRHELELGPGSVAVLARSANLIPEPAGRVGPVGNVGPVGLSLKELPADWKINAGSAEASIRLPAARSPLTLHLVFRQFDGKGFAVRTSGGAPPNGKSMAELLRIEAFQNGSPLQVHRPDDKIVWSGLSWAYGIIRPSLDTPITVKVNTTDPAVTRIEPRVYAL